MGKLIAPITNAITYLIKLLYGVIGNYGLSIIGVTLLVKLILLPLTLKQDKSMREMKRIQPELDKLKEKYKDDPQAMNTKTMELYKEHQINPLGGCLPLLVQMPFLFALFAALRDPALFPPTAKFLWMTLSKPDPFFILPVLTALVTFYQQKMSGASDNPATKNMMYIFPVMMLFISYKMPSGLQIYWVTSSAISVLQQIFILKRGEKIDGK